MDKYERAGLEAERRNAAALVRWLEDIHTVPAAYAARQHSYVHVVGIVAKNAAGNSLHDVAGFILHRMNRFKGQFPYSPEIRIMAFLHDSLMANATSWVDVLDEMEVTP